MGGVESRTIFMSREKPETRRKDIMRHVLSRGAESERIETLWQIVKEIGTGVNHQDLLLDVSMIVPNAKNKRLILLFYLYLENVEAEDEEGNLKDEILMICNTVRTHLIHPNEHVRTKAARFVGRLRNTALFDALKGPFAENISHGNSFVRCSTYIALRGLMRAEETAGVFEDVLGKMKEQMAVERDASCFAEGYRTLEEVDPEGALVYYREKRDTAQDIVKKCFLRTAERLDDVERVKEMCRKEETRDMVVEGSLALLRIGKTKEVVKGALETLFEISDEYLDVGTKGKIVKECRRIHKKGVYGFEGTGLKIAKLIRGAVARTSPELAKEIFSLVMEVLVITETKDFFSFLLQEFSESFFPKEEKQKKTNASESVLFLSFLKEMACVHKMHRDTLTEEVIELLGADSAEIAQGAAMYLKSLVEAVKQVRDAVVMKISKSIGDIKDEKTLKKILSLISANAGAEVAKSSLASLLSALSSKKQSLLGTLESQQPDSPKVFPGVYLSEFLLEMAGHAKDLAEEEEQEAHRAAAVGVALKAYAVGKRTGAMDEASKVSLLRTADLISSDAFMKGAERREAQEGSKRKKEAKKGREDNEMQNFTARPSFSLVREAEAPRKDSGVKRFAEKKTSVPLSNLKNVFQLTSLADPLYCECQITCHRTEIVLDMLLINQTETHLEDVEVDLVSSQNIRVVSAPFLERIRPHSAQTVSAVLVMEEADSGFIGGVIGAGRIGREDYFLQNLQEMKFSLSDMLKHKEISKKEFRERWSTLVWENFYYLPIKTPVSALNDLVKAVENEIKGTVVEVRTKDKGRISAGMQGSPEILIKNLFTTTSQGTDVFVNAVVYKGEASTVASFRIRGEQYRVVKSICQLISKTLKTATSQPAR